VDPIVVKNAEVNGETNARNNKENGHVEFQGVGPSGTKAVNLPKQHKIFYALINIDE